jgi:hypothetical protein
MSVHEWYGPSRATMLAREFDKNHPGEILPADPDEPQALVDVPICTCGHSRRGHEEEPPYECGYFDCACQAFTYPPKPEDDRMHRALSHADRILSCGWRVVLRAERHVMADTGWPWRVRFEASGFLWRHALELCKGRILGL